jgi:hypothetical protein
MNRINSVKFYIEKFLQAFTACGLSMVQGDISVLTLKHILVASKTGSLTVIAFYITSLINWRYNSKILPIYLLGLFTVISDLIVHPTHFGPAYAEALVTGAVAMLICFIYERTLNVK